MTCTTRFVPLALALGFCILAAGCGKKTVQTPPPAVATVTMPTTSPAPTNKPAANQATTRPDWQRGKLIKAIAFNIVYLVDNTGSMSPIFDDVRQEITKSIDHLPPRDDFTIICFGGNDEEVYVEGPTRHLVSATRENKIKAARFLRKVAVAGPTYVLPGLKRAFAVLKYSDPRKQGRLIYLVSDGDFAGLSGGSRYTDNKGETLRGNAAVIQWLRENNPKRRGHGRVYVSTFLYRSRDPNAVKAMKTIAQENGGVYTIVSTNE